MNSQEVKTIDRLNRAICCIIRGSFCDAREILRSIEPTQDTTLAEMIKNLIRAADSLSEEISYKEIALAHLQNSKLELEDAHKRLEASKALYLTTLVSIGDGIITTDTKGHVDFMNPVAESYTGWKNGDAQGVNVTDVVQIVNSTSHTAIDNPIWRVMSEGITVSIANNTLMIARDGTERMIANSCAPIRNTDETLLGAVLVLRDVTSEYQRQEQLRESEDRYRALFEGVGEGILMIDKETHACMHSNEKWRNMFGYGPEEVLRLSLPELHPPETHQETLKDFEEGAPGTVSNASALPCLHKDGTIFYSDIRGTIISINNRLFKVGFFSDVSRNLEYEKELESEKTLREKAEVELLHAQKLQSVGQLAAGVAHEINTPIQFVGDNVHFLKDSLSEMIPLLGQLDQFRKSQPEPATETSQLTSIVEAVEKIDVPFLTVELPKAIEQTLQGVDRVATIVRAMKDFSHPDMAEKMALDVNKALDTTLTVARNELKYVADVVTEFQDNLPIIDGHPGELNQVFLNLLVNAAHSIQDVVDAGGERGEITVRTKQDGNSVLISVSDTGKGIPEHVQHRIFDPFFTTKQVGKGTGQGLAIARSVVIDKHGGKIWFETEENKGTTFFVRLPMETEKAAFI